MAETEAIITRLAEIPCPHCDGRGRFVVAWNHGEQVWEQDNLCKGTGARLPWVERTRNLAGQAIAEVPHA